MSADADPVSNAKLVLNSVIRAIGFTQGGWRHPDATPQRALDLSYYQEYARISERGLFDGLFVANTPAARSNDWTTLFSPLEPVALLSALASTTSSIALIPTLSSTFNHPYNVARQIATLDHLSGGRAGVNIVTSGSLDAARNLGYDELPGHDDRYERAHEFLDVLYQLWDSWGTDALIVDKAAGVQSKPGSVNPIGFRGKHFAVHGALDHRLRRPCDPVAAGQGNLQARVRRSRFTSRVRVAHHGLSWAPVRNLWARNTPTTMAAPMTASRAGGVGMSAVPSMPWRIACTA